MLPERERLYAVFRLLGFLQRAVDELRDEAYTMASQAFLEALYEFRGVRQPSVEELIEAVKEAMGLSDDSELVRLLRHAASSAGSGESNRR